MEEAASFPCPVERTVASALLLLSTPPPTLLFPQWNDECMSDDDSESWAISTSKSYNSTSAITDESCSSADLPLDRRRRTSHLSARSHQMKLEVVRKSRSKKFWISDCGKASSGKSASVSWGSETTSEASSCLSNNTSSISNATTKTSSGDMKKGKVLFASPHLCRRAESIMGILAGGKCISEVRIRELLGDSPDTSKALRMLMKQAKVKRSGAGGRTDPFIYMIAT